MLQLRKCNKKNNLSGHVKLIRSEITVLTEKVEEKLDLIRSKFSEKTIASQTQRRMLRGWR